jgi:uncharacterized tellurite resistance protein B-like protein
MENTNQKLDDLLKVTFVFSVLSSTVDTEETKEISESIGVIVIESVSEDLMESAFETALSGTEQYDIVAAMDAISKNLEEDFEATVDWAGEKFDNFDRESQLKVLTAVYRVLQVDGKVSQSESEFLNHILAHAKISLEEIVEAAQMISGSMGIIDGMNETLEETSEE